MYLWFTEGFDLAFWKDPKNAADNESSKENYLFSVAWSCF